MKETINVYWSVQDELDSENNWNILYNDLESVYYDKSKNINKTNKRSFFICPAFKDYSQSSFVVKNPLHSKFLIQNNLPIPQTSSFINSRISHEDSIYNNKCLVYGLSYYFFSEESVSMTLTSPSFHKFDYIKYGSLIPGRYDISSWFRPINLEFNLWDKVDFFEIKKDEPVAYFSFDTTKKIRLIRFSMNKELDRISKTCSSASSWEEKIPLLSRYERFKKSRTDKIVLKNIKQNII